MRKKTDTKIEDGFLTRWSAKKSQADNPLVETESDTGQVEIINNQNQVGQHAENQLPLSPADEQPVLTDEDMPDVETLDEKSDFSGFLSPGVSDGLRKLALRKLFRSKVFNVRDGLDDYDDDFRSFAALGNIVTSDMKHQMELAEEREKQREKQKQDQEKLAAEKQPAPEGSEDSTDDVASEDQDSGDQDREVQHIHVENSENEDAQQKNESSEVVSEKKQDPQAQ